MSPREEILTAARALRDAAERSAPGPWPTTGLPACAAHWIGLAGPHLADPIATWLERMAASWPPHLVHTSTAQAASERRDALAVAREINRTVDGGSRTSRKSSSKAVA